MSREEKLKILRNCFNAADPVGIFYDENTDEYDSEIEELINSNVDLKDVGKTKLELDRIFKKYFEGITINDDKIKELTKKITSSVI